MKEGYKFYNEKPNTGDHCHNTQIQSDIVDEREKIPRTSPQHADDGHQGKRWYQKARKIAPFGTKNGFT